MNGFGEEALRVVEDGDFVVQDAGPLSAPIKKISIQRNDKFVLEAKTVAPDTAVSSGQTYPLGTVRMVTEKVVLQNSEGVEAVLEGVTCGSTYKWNHGDATLEETARANRLIVTPRDPLTAAYTIDWLENLPQSDFFWPSSIISTGNLTIIKTGCAESDGFTIPVLGGRLGGSRCAASLEIEGLRLFVLALDPRDYTSARYPGCIVYVGAPDEFFRKKVRTALSFALGRFLIDLGSTLYDEEWNILQATTRSAYTLEGRAFDRATMPLAPLGPGCVSELQPAELNRMVGNLVHAYDQLSLATVSWDYWHASVAISHTAPGQFGAAIEALQEAWLTANPGKIERKIIPKGDWRHLLEKLRAVVIASSISEEAKTKLSEKLSYINKIDQRPLLEALFKSLGIRLSKRENYAWKRRNGAAHGRPIPEGEQVAVIEDIYVLRGMFNRMLIRMTDAADLYVDYTIGSNKYRRLVEPPEDLPPKTSNNA